VDAPLAKSIPGIRIVRITKNPVKLFIFIFFN
jgi:hypothetical protein